MKPCVLVIDDEESMRDVIRLILEKEGWDVLEAVDGREGVREFEAFADRIKLIITDIIMPNMEGLETIMKLHKKHPDLKILAISGGGRHFPENYLPMAMTLGAQGALVKPFDRAELLEAMNRIGAPNPKANPTD